MTTDTANAAGGPQRVPTGPASAAPAPPGADGGSDYAALSRTVRRAGLMRRRPGWYGPKIATNLLLTAVGWTAFVLIGRSWWQLLTAVFLAVMFGQSGFIGHDAGHRQITGSRRADDLIGRIHGNLLIGLCYGWWISKHNRHHAHPNEIGRDPDIAGNAITFTKEHTRARRGPGIWMARSQAWLFFPILLLEGWHLHIAGVRVLMSRRGIKVRLIEASLLAVHIAGFAAALALVLSPAQAVAFALVQQGLFGLYMGSSFAPNHKGMAMFRDGEKVDYLRRQVLTSRNIRGGPVTDFALGGLNYQIEHHLFPSMPRPNLRHARTLVRECCARHGIRYCETDLLSSYAQVLRHLNAVGGPLRPELEY